MLAGLKARLSPVFDVPRQHDRRWTGRVAIPLMHRRGVMFVRVYRASPPPPRVFWAWLLAGLALLAMICLVITAVAQVNLPEVVARAAKPKPKPGAAAHVRLAPAPAARVMPAPAVTPAEQLAARTTALNQGLNTIYAPTGTAPTTISQTLSRRCHRERTQRSKRSCCSYRALLRIRRPAVVSMFATNTPTCRPASTESCFRTASAALARSSTPP